MKVPPHTRKHAGFTLIELAVVLVIIGIIVSIIASVLPSLIQSGKIKKAQAILEKSDYALQGYSLANHRLPFADSDGDGQEDTNTYLGYLPYLTLGLSSGNDVWGNTLQYGVYSTLTATFADGSAFCAAISAASATAFTTTEVYTTSADPCSGADSSNSSNQAYVLASGGLKDLDGADGFFDACNGMGDPGFNSPATFQSGTYDDLVRSFSLNELNQKNCGGGGSGGGGGGGSVENSYTNGCTNGIDDDGDGYTDCADPDCFGDPACSGSSDVAIVTTSIPSDTIGSSYSAVFSATGGITPYQWELTGNGGFDEFYLHPYTASLTGTLDQCPGTYTIDITVEDSTLPADGGPKSDTHSFALNVTGNLSIARTSGAGTDITWSSASQQESFTANGGHIGDINWTLDTGGASGFSVVSASSITCVIKKSGISSAGTYTFTLGAEDADCPGNTAELILSVTVLSSGIGSPGALGSIIDSLEFDTSYAATPNIVNVAADMFAIVYRGPDSDGFIRTVGISTDGQIGNSIIDSLEFDTSSGYEPRIINVSGDVTAVAHRGNGSDGYVGTIDIAANGQIGNSVVDSLEYDPSAGYTPDIVHISGDIYAIAYRGPGSDGFVRTVRINAAGQISNSTIDTLEFDAANGYEPDIIHVSGNVYAIAYRGSGSDGFVKTITIASNGQIGNAVVDSYEFEASNCITPNIINISGNVYAIAYRGPNDDGFIKSLEIADDGQITYSVLDTLEFDTAAGYEPNIMNLPGDVCAIAYRGSGNDGFVITVEVDSSGQIGDSLLDSFEFDTSNGYEPNIAHVSGNVYAIAYRGNGSDGFVVTFTITQ